MSLIIPEKTSYVKALNATESVSIIENKLFDIFEEDKKLAQPVFLFIREEIIHKLVRFLTSNMKRPFAMGIAGATASGKSTFASDVFDALTGVDNSIGTRIN